MNPTFDVASVEKVRTSSWEDDKAFLLWRELRDALANVADYLDAKSDMGTTSLHAAMLEGFLSSPIRGNLGDHSSTVRERLAVWRREDWTRPHTRSRRTVLVQGYGHPDVMWWLGRSPSVRDLAILSLLAGCVPEAAKRQQHQAVGEADRPTVRDVVLAEENAVRAAVGRPRRRELKPTH